MTITPEMIQNKMHLTMSQVAKKLGVTNLTTFKTTLGAQRPSARSLRATRVTFMYQCVFWPKYTDIKFWKNYTDKKLDAILYVYFFKYMQFFSKINLMFVHFSKIQLNRYNFSNVWYQYM